MIRYRDMAGGLRTGSDSGRASRTNRLDNRHDQTATTQRRDRHHHTREDGTTASQNRQPAQPRNRQPQPVVQQEDQPK